jgi:hypothetical protein
MRRLMSIAAVVVLASCSRPVSPPASDLAMTIEGRVAGPTESCISTNSASGLRALDPQTLAYGGGRTVYINRLPGPCPGITPTSTLFVEVQSSRYCHGDRVRGREFGGMIAGPTCILGDWVPYTQTR